MAIVGDEDDLGEPAAAADAPLVELHERLPWLEADDDDEEDRVDTGRLIVFVVGSVLVLALIIGGGYWLLRDRSDTVMVADGSTIEAPEGDYKEKPEDPGGATAPGTGDTSFAVAEGQSPPSRVATAASAPRPSAASDERESVPTGVGVQVGAYSSRERAELGWQTLSGRQTVLSGVSHRIVQGTADGAMVYRLQAVAGSMAEARQLCADLKAGGADCQVKS